MPVIAVFAAGAAYFGSSLAVGAMVSAGMVAAGSFAAIAVGVVAGAVIGAAVGAIGAAITGGDIGKGALWGAVGGAVAGGIAGFSAVGSASQAATSGVGKVASSADQIGGQSLMNGTTTASSSLPTAVETGMTAGKGTMYGQGIASAGQMVTGYAQGEAAGATAETNAAAAEKARQEEFDQRMKEIQANHENSLKDIAAQTEGQMTLSEKNNAAAMSQLNTRIGAEKDAVTATTAEKDAKIAALNDSIRGTDASLFERPTFDFKAQEGTAFDSGFSAAAAQSPNLSPEELLALEQRQAIA